MKPTAEIHTLYDTESLRREFCDALYRRRENRFATQFALTLLALAAAALAWRLFI